MDNPITNLEAEKSVLGCIMVEKNAILKVSTILKPEDFYYESNAEIYDCFLTLAEKRSPIDMVIVESLLSDRKKLEEVGGRTYLIELCDTVLTASHIVAYAEEVLKASVFRNLSKASREIKALATQTELSQEEAVAQAQQILTGISRSKIEERKISAPKQLDKFDAFVRERMRNNAVGIVPGIPTGFSQIDQDSLPEKGHLIILGARPSVGKSALAGNLAYNAAMMGSHVYYASLEMTPEELMSRIYARIAKISSTRFKYGQVDDAILRRCKMDLESMLGSLEFDFIPGATSAQIIARAELVQNLDILIVDHIDLISDRVGKNSSRTQMLGDVTAALKAFAGKKNCVVLALSQLARDAKNEMPELFHLRDSGAKEQDADDVWLLHRNPDPEAADSLAYLNLAKNRTGRKGAFALKFDPSTCTFSELAAPVPPPVQQVKETFGKWEELC